MIEFLKSKSIGFYLRAAAVILSVIPVFYMAVIASVEYVAGLVFVLAGIAALIVSLVFDGKMIGKYVGLAGSAALSVGFALFAVGSCLSVIDYIYNIVMWGDAKQFPFIMTFGVFLLVGTGLSIASCWLVGSKNAEKQNMD